MNVLPGITNPAQLQADACSAIEKWHDLGLQKIWPGISWPPTSAGACSIGKNQWEAHLTGHLCSSMIDVASAWRLELAKQNPTIKLSLTSVFTHLTPQVTWTASASQKTCELADLLICFIDRTAPTPGGSAILIQAKQYDTHFFTLTSSGERTQFDLLSKRPVFNVKASMSAPTGVDLGGLVPDVALLYGLNEPDTDPPTLPLRTDRWLSAMGLNSLAGSYSATATECLAGTLVELGLGNRGWDFELPPAGANWSHFASPATRDDWSMLINYLLEVTLVPASKYIPATVTNPSGQRGAEHQMFLRASGARGEMYAFGSYEAGHRLAPLGWISGTDVEYAPRWTELNNNPLASDGGAPPSSVPDGMPGESESGPISVIVFEVEMCRD